MQKMMQNGGSGSGGMATISFASNNSHGRSHGGSSGLNSSTHLDRSDRGGGGGSSSSSAALQNPNDPMFVSNRRARSNNFTLKETFDLLKVWASPEMQWQMKHNFRNFRVWEAISYQMGQMGHDRTAIQCKNRIQNLTSIFYRIKKSKQDYRTFNFPYYKLIGDVLDGKKAGVSLGASFASSAHVFGIPHPNDPFLNAANSSGNAGGGSGRNSESPNSSHGFAQHLALVEEYQHLINGQPDNIYGGSNGTNGTSANAGGRPSSNNSNSGHNVLSPEISLSEGDSPIRVDTSTPPVGKSAGGSNKNASRNGPSGKHYGDGDLPTSILKIEHDDSMNITLEDNGDLEDDEQNYDMMDEAMGMGEEDEYQDDMLDNSSAGARNKRSFSASFGAHTSGGGSALGAVKGFPIKRARGVSNTSSGGLGGFSGHHARPRMPTLVNGGAAAASDDPIVQYLSDMVDIERQWLDMERERADNERSMMMYMMQILQALVCPTDQDDEAEAEAGEEGAGDEEQDGQSQSDLLDQQTTMDENSDDPDAEPSTSASPAAPSSSHQKSGDRDTDETAQLRQMLRDNGAGEEGEEDGTMDDDEDLLEEGDDDSQQQQTPTSSTMVKKGSIEITTTRSHGQNAKPPSLPASITITKTN